MTKKLEKFSKELTLTGLWFLVSVWLTEETVVLLSVGSGKKTKLYIYWAFLGTSFSQCVTLQLRPKYLHNHLVRFIHVQWHFFSCQSLILSLLFVHELHGPAPGAENFANSEALYCVGWKKRPSCEVSVRLGLINEQTGRQVQLSLSFLSWINEAFLKDTPHCSSHWSNIPQHLTLPNFL